MIDHRLNEYQNHVLEQLWHEQLGGCSHVFVEPYMDNFAITFQRSPRYFGSIYPMRAVLKDRRFKKSYNPEEVVNYFRVRNRLFRNRDVCSTCKKLKFYPNVYLLALQCDIDDLVNPLRSKSGNKLFYVFCKHHDILGFLDYDYFTEDDEDSSEDDGTYMKDV